MSDREYSFRSDPKQAGGDDRVTFGGDAGWDLTDTQNVRVEDGSVVSDSGLPESEGFEHDDLTANYGGETGAFSVQTGTVSGDSFALFGDGGGDTKAIVRNTQDEWGPDVRIRARRYVPDAGSVGNGGIAFGCQSVTGYSSLSCYWGYVDAGARSSGSRIRRLRRVDSGASTNLTSTKSSTIGTETWVDERIDWHGDGTIEWTLDGETLTATDTTYSGGYLGFLSYRDDYWDDVTFETL